MLEDAVFVNCFRFALAVAALILGVAASAESAKTARMDQIVQSYVDDKAFMGTVLVAEGDRILFDKAYGKADLAWNVPNTPSSKFRIASITKQFTAAAILLLEQDGRLDTTDPVVKHLPDAPESWKKITLAHLLTHTSGIPSLTEEDAPESIAISPDALVARIRDKKLSFEPGERMDYSNAGYAVLGLIVEKISGVRFAEFLRERIFVPLGMRDTGTQVAGAIIPRHAIGYDLDGDQYVQAGLVDPSVPYAAGCLYSTTHDLRRWEEGLFGGRLLSSKSLAKMLTPNKNGYGFGVGIVEGGKGIEHSGGIQGFSSDLLYYPDRKLVVAVLGNVHSDAPPEIAAHLAAVALGRKVILKSERPSTAQPNVHVLPQKIAMPELGRERILRIYLPPDYDARPERRFPVIYMHDGQNLFDDRTSYVGEWGVDETLNDLARTTGFEAIVVGIDHGGKWRGSELNPEPGPVLKKAEGRQYLDFIVQTLKPMIDRSYRTLPDREHTAIMGSSLGGLISHYALQIHPETFSKYGVFSPSYWAAPGLVAKAAEQDLPADTKVYLYIGGAEGGIHVDMAQAMYETLKAKGPDGAVAFHLVPDAIHNEKPWSQESLRR